MNIFSYCKLLSYTQPLFHNSTLHNEDKAAKRLLLPYPALFLTSPHKRPPELDCRSAWLFQPVLEFATGALFANVPCERSKANPRLSIFFDTLQQIWVHEKEQLFP